MVNHDARVSELPSWLLGYLVAPVFTGLQPMLHTGLACGEPPSLRSANVLTRPRGWCA